MNQVKQVIGYLPDEKPNAWKLLLYALQQVIVMFPATIAVALITGFQVSTTIFASGLATLCFIMISGRKIPLYYGSSFSYLTAVIGLMTSQSIMGKLSPEALTQLQSWLDKSTSVMPGEAIAYAQFGIIASGLISIIAGLIVRFSGKDAVEKVLPPTITGSIAMIIGLTLAGNAPGRCGSRHGGWCGGDRCAGQRMGLGCITDYTAVDNTVLALSERFSEPAATAAGRCCWLPDCGCYFLGRRCRLQSVQDNSQGSVGRVPLVCGADRGACIHPA